MECSLTDRPSLTFGKLLVDFNIDLTFFIRSRLKKCLSSDLDLTGEKSAFGWACESATGETRGAESGELRCAEIGDFKTREACETCDLTVSSWTFSWSTIILCFIRRRLIDPAVILVLLLSSRHALRRCIAPKPKKIDSCVEAQNHTQGDTPGVKFLSPVALSLAQWRGAVANTAFWLVDVSHHS